MRITVSFLNKRMFKIKKIIENVFFISTFLMLFIFITTLITLSFSRENIEKILYLATDVRQAEESFVEISDIAKIFPVYNPNNYNFENSEIISANNKEDNLSEEDKEYAKKLESIDSFADKNLEAVGVFLKGNQYNINVYQNTDDVQKIAIQDSKILNYSSMRDINYSELMGRVINLTKKSDSILIYHTHTSETYTADEKNPISYTSNYRTTDAKSNMLRVGKEFERNLTSKGFNVYQDTTSHDYGTYVSAYSKSRITVSNTLKTLSQKSNVGISMDIHRDAMADLTSRPLVNINGIEVAQCMLVLGVGSDTNKNEFALDNLALALKIQMIADKYYPGLFRPMLIRDSLYNQDLNKYSLLVEVGSTGNNIEEVLFSTRCLTNILNIVYKN